MGRSPTGAVDQPQVRQAPRPHLSETGGALPRVAQTPARVGYRADIRAGQVNRCQLQYSTEYGYET